MKIFFYAIKRIGEKIKTLKIKKILSNLFIFLFFLLSLLLIYHPIYTIEYLHHDDAFFCSQLKKTIHPQSAFFLLIGRYIQAYLLTIVNWFFYYPSDLYLLRLSGIFQLSIIGSILSWWLRKYFSFRDSLLIALAIITLPPFTIMVSWTTATYGFTAIIFSLLAVYCAYKIPFHKIPWQRRLFSCYCWCGLFFLLCAFSTYQPTACFYWAVVLLIMLFENRQCQLSDFVSRTINLFILGFITMAVYGVILILTTPQVGDPTLPPQYNLRLMTTDYTAKFRWFLYEPAVNALNFWNIFPRKDIALTVVLFMVFSLLLFLVKARAFNPKTFVKIFIYTGSVTLLVVLSLLPSLIVSKALAVYRVLAALMVMMIIFMIWIIEKWVNFLPHFLRRSVLTLIFFSAVILGSVQAYRNTLTVVIPGYIEFKYVKENVLKLLVDDSKDKLLYIPCSADLPSVRYDEFGFFTTMEPNNLQPLTVCSLMEIARESSLSLKHLDQNRSASFYHAEFFSLNGAKTISKDFYSGSLEGKIPENINSLIPSSIIVDMRNTCRENKAF